MKKNIFKGFNAIDKEYYIEREGQEVVLILCGNGVPLKRGRYNGPHEKCYPDEGGYVEDVTAFDPKTHETVELTEGETKQAEQHLFEMLCELDECPE